jgi:hypothetical protein
VSAKEPGAIKAKARKTYRADRYDAYLGVRVSVKLDAAIEAMAEATNTRPSDCLGWLLKHGLKAWQENPEARMAEELVARGVDITPALQADLAEESKKLRVSHSDFARRLLVEGFKVWREQQRAKISTA